MQVYLGYALKLNIRIVLVDDQVLILEAISVLLNAQGARYGIGVVACAKDYQEVLLAVQKHEPNLVLLDMHMHKVNGSDVARKLKQRLPDLKVLMLSSSEDIQDIAQACAAGADGYAFKSDTPEVLIKTILRVDAGYEEFISNVSPDQLPLSKDYGLTRRERQVLKLLTEGEHNQGIANCLGISVRTAEKHREHLLTKLSKPNPVALSKIALELGLIEP